MSHVTFIYNESSGSYEAKELAQDTHSKYPRETSTISFREIISDEDKLKRLLSTSDKLLVLGGDGTFSWTAVQIARLNQLDRRASLALIPLGGLAVNSQITTGVRPIFDSRRTHLGNIVEHLISDDGYFQEVPLPIRKVIVDENIKHPFFWGAFLGQDGVTNWSLRKIEQYRYTFPTFTGRFLQSVKDAFTVGLPKPKNLIRVGFNGQCKEVVEAITFSPDIPYWAQFSFPSREGKTGLLLLNPNNKPNIIRILDMFRDIKHIEHQLKNGKQPTSLTGTYEYHTLETALQVVAPHREPHLVLDSERTGIEDWHGLYHDPRKDNGHIKIIRRVKKP